jgi:DNA-binding transcriptional LysR family regulator
MQVDAEVTGRVVDLVHEGFDLAIRVGPLADSTLAARRLGVLTYSLYAAPGYLAGRPPPAGPDGLKGHDLLVFTGTGQRAAWQLQRGSEAQRVPLNPRLRATNTFSVRDAAVQGLGIALLPRRLGDPLVEDGRLRVVLPDWSPPEVPVHAVFASARYLAPKVRAFIDLAAQMFGPHDRAGPGAGGPENATGATRRRLRAPPAARRRPGPRT